MGAPSPSDRQQALISAAAGTPPDHIRRPSLVPTGPDRRRAWCRFGRVRVRGKGQSLIVRQGLDVPHDGTDKMPGDVQMVRATLLGCVVRGEGAQADSTSSTSRASCGRPFWDCICKRREQKKSGQLAIF
jgi:hypothetical protein